MRTCRTCKVDKSLTEYQKHSTYKDGISTQCKLCVSAYRKAIRAANLERDREYTRKYKQKNREIVLQRSKKYVVENPEKRKETMRLYRQRTRPLQLSYARKRQAAKLQRTPKWLAENDFWMMQEAYHLAELRTKLFNFTWHVDHIIPLRGKLVSGLHTPYNLQVIPGKDNVSKANRYEVIN